MNKLNATEYDKICQQYKDIITELAGELKWLRVKAEITNDTNLISLDEIGIDISENPLETLDRYGNLCNYLREEKKHLRAIIEAKNSLAFNVMHYNDTLVTPDFDDGDEE